MISIKKGLNLPILGEPVQKIEQEHKADIVALIGPDYVGMKPTMMVKEGDEVKIGQKLFEDKKNPGVFFTSPAAGKVMELNRGHRRAFQSVVIGVSSNEEHVNFDSFSQKDINAWDRDGVKRLLIESGMWTALRTRPFSKTPAVDSTPEALFINAMDTNPLAPDPAFIISNDIQAFSDGVQILSKLTDGKTYVCKEGGKKIDLQSGGNIVVKEFKGPHPAGNVGTHIHFLHPVNYNKRVWHIGYQDVIAVGRLFKTGKLFLDRIVSLAGPMVEKPRLIRTRVGANCLEITDGELKKGEARVISGSVFNGRKCWGPFGYLGRFSNQITVVAEDREREFLGWHKPGLDKFSVKPVFVSALLGTSNVKITTNRNGSDRAMVPVGMYEKVMPLDILPTQLLKSLITKNTELGQQLGVLELDEEDLALCTYVDPGKVDYGPILRENLTIIEKEG